MAQQRETNEGKSTAADNSQESREGWKPGECSGAKITPEGAGDNRSRRRSPHVTRLEPGESGEERWYRGGSPPFWVAAAVDVLGGDELDYRETLHLPKTDFPMRANLPEREPIFLQYWEEGGLYEAGLKEHAGVEPFILHDGPPYANGNIHIGTALNKVLKDTVSRYMTMRGRPSPYVPGWDTHGLPIERLALEELKRDRHGLDPLTLRRVCKDFAMRHIEAMTGQFKRLGVIGDWAHPYITLQPEYEAAELRVFGEMYERGLVYKGFRSVHWCPIDETALADAEIEYREHTSPSIYVLFPVADAGGKKELEGAGVVIWTTTPWTMPANEAVALHPDLEYGVYESPQGPLVVAVAARERMEKILSIGKELARVPARRLAGVRMLHPVFDKTVPIVFGQHVSAEDGTGAVHTAPGHGEEDFQVGREYGLPVTVPVDDQGNFNELAGPFAGQRYDKANPAIMEYLRGRGRLLHAGEIRHQYPHCWRCHGPVLFRATEQWFGSVSAIRDDILAAISKVSWVPEWGEVRMRQMTQDRQDWCISRQRVWGVPIPAFYCAGCGDVLVTRETVGHVADLVAANGADIWWERSVEDLLPPGTTCGKCGGTEFRKETDILDVWFDSGSSHAAVLAGRDDLRWPADLYLEGADQFRGWFNSSLTTSIAVNGEPPYRQVLVHGFVVDGEGRKMSKSLQNAVSPEAVLKQYGADVLRLWATSADYTADIHLTPEILQQVAEGYRKIRNTWRFLLGNLQDFEPTRDAVPLSELTGLEAYMRGRLGELVATVQRAYQSYGYQGVYYHALNFCAVDLSSLYLDVRKDLLYCARADDPARRAAQTLIWHAASVIARLFAPILPFTAEEVWEHLPGGRAAHWSVHLASFPEAADFAVDAPTSARYAELLALRDEVLKALEAARAEKRIGKPSDARLRLTLPAGPLLELVQAHAAEFEELCIVSAIEVAAGERAVLVEADAAPRCERCWLHRDDVNESGLCGRCQDVLAR